ncbi:ATP-binding protein [Paenibacillus abyssi]|uniref:ATPase n=1 Tax=Paenibacillus abyssi TaxID=1340531 RepID=A0A917FVP3_9BACL|nr:ATP-binding protein [Paenibacillus abyssi]GGG05654.1 ATPase [Paenibacillus abyssi]
MKEAIFEQQWVMPSAYGSEKAVMQKVKTAISRICPGEQRIEDMLTAIAEACLNAIEHGNLADFRLPVTLQLTIDGEKYKFRIIDHGSNMPVVQDELPLPDKWLEEHPRGWGLFLIRRLSDHAAFGSENGEVYLDIIFYR